MASSSTLVARVARTTSLGGFSVQRTAHGFGRTFALLAARTGAFPQPRAPFPSELFSFRSGSSTSQFSTSSAINSAQATRRQTTSFFAEDRERKPVDEDARSFNMDELEEEIESTMIQESRVPFTELTGKIHPGTMKAITVKPFKHTHLSPVQEKVLPLLPELAQPYSEGSKNPRDLLVKAKTGTGKTMAFLVPAIEARLKDLAAHKDQVRQSLNEQGLLASTTELIRAENSLARKTVGTLIISPTRELATQIAVEAHNLTKHHPGFQIHVLVGGESRSRQLREWHSRKDIIVATPGRLNDLLEEPEVREAIATTNTLILDEADTLLDMGFKSDIDRISKHLPPSPARRTFLFSATVSRSVQAIAEKILSPGHMFINCVNEDESAVHEHVPQYHTVLKSGEEALEHLVKLLAHDQLTAIKNGHEANSKVIIFFSTTKMVQMFAELLRYSQYLLPLSRNTEIYEMHAKKDMKQRINTSKNFRQSTAKAAIMITSDVSARGVDYPGVTRVIQMGTPASQEMYVHRVGRTGRAGKSGRGDLVLFGGFEMPFLNKVAQAGVNLQPKTVAEVHEEVDSLAHHELPHGGGRGVAKVEAKTYAPTLSTVSEEIKQTLGKIPEDDLKEVFASQLGFYVGRLGETGMRSHELYSGMGSFIKELGMLEREPTLSPAMQAKLFGSRRMSNDRYGGQRDRQTRWGTYGTGRDFRGPGRNENNFRPWESRGSSRGGRVGGFVDREEGGFSSSRGGDHSSSRGGYSSSRGGYSSSRGGYASSRGGQASSRGGYASSRGSHASSRGDHSSSRGGYSGDYLNSRSGIIPNAKGRDSGSRDGGYGESNRGGGSMW